MIKFVAANINIFHYQTGWFYFRKNITSLSQSLVPGLNKINSSLRKHLTFPITSSVHLASSTLRQEWVYRCRCWG
jgi:hypothetical protein